MYRIALFRTVLLLKETEKKKTGKETERMKKLGKGKRESENKIKIQ